MFYKKYYLDISPIHGIGLFAGEEIKTGEIIRLPSKNLTFLFTKEDLSCLRLGDREVIRHYGYLHKKTNIWHFSSEDSRYTNHSENPNVCTTPDNKNGLIAKKNIKTGEEITQDYRDFEELRDF